jgi:sugar lactone lactonase YvrE
VLLRSIIRAVLTTFVGAALASSAAAQTVSTYQSNVTQGFGLLASPGGDLIVSQRNPVSTILRVSINGTRSTFASGQGLNDVVAMCWGSGGDIYAADFAGGPGRTGAIWRISASGIVSLVTSSVARPAGIARAADGTLYASEYFTLKVKKIAQDGTVTTLASPVGPPAGDVMGLAIAGNGDVLAGTKAGLYRITPAGSITAMATGFSVMSLARGGDGAWYAAAYSENQLMRITDGGQASVVAGTGTPGLLNGAPLSARFQLPSGIALLPSGDLMVADFGNNALRVLALSAQGVAVRHTSWGRIKALGR